MNSNSQDQTPLPPIPAEAVEAAARKMHENFGPFCDDLYPWDHPLSSSDMFLTLARAALTAAAPLLAGWRKLEGEPDPKRAPWDGNEVDLIHSGHRVADCHYHCGEWLTNQRVSADADDRIWVVVEDASHWMPLPLRPPAEGSA